MMTGNRVVLAAGWHVQTAAMGVVHAVQVQLGTDRCSQEPCRGREATAPAHRWKTEASVCNATGPDGACPFERSRGGRGRR